MNAVTAIVAGLLVLAIAALARVARQGAVLRAQLRAELLEARHSERRLTAFLDATTVAFWRMEAEAHGHDEGLELIHPQDRESFLAGWRQALVERGLWEATYRMRRPDGTFAHMRGRNVPLLGEDGTLLEWVGAVTDVTADVEMTETLRRSEASFRAIIEQTPDLVFAHRDGRIIYANPAACSALGYARETLQGMEPIALVDAGDRDIVWERLGGAGTGAPPSAGLVHLVHADGHRLACEITGMPSDFQGEPSTIVIARDQTERLQMQERLMFANRMVSVGTLASGIAHEINNPLAYVMSNLTFAVREIERCVAAKALAPALEALEESREGAGRIRAIVRDLKSHARPTERLEPIALEAVIESSIHMALNEIRHRARLVRSFESECPMVLGNEGRLGQVVLNLLVNAAHAIREGNAASNEIRVSLFSIRESVVVEIVDSGCGIPPDVLPRIFDPFFTTKPVGVGTGLGLFICHNIVSSMGGRITVESGRDKGTCFRLTFAAAQRLEAEPEAAPVASGASEPGGARILLIDDEPMILSGMIRTLHGHQVVAARSGREGLGHIRNDAPYDVVFCDLMMPEMSGMDVYEAVQAISPETASRMVMVTGGAFTPDSRQFLETTQRECLEKPVSADVLEATITRYRRPAAARSAA